MTSTGNTTSRIWTIPNLISLARLFGVAWFWWVLVVDENIALAAWLIFIIGWSDWIDGYLARKLNQVSELGKVLDPVADRVMIVSAVVGGLIVGVVPPIIAIPLLIRETIMGATAIYLVLRGGGTLPVRYLGKVATFALYGAVFAFYLAGADFVRILFLSLAWGFGVVGLVLYWYVLVQYLGDARARLTRLESPPNPTPGIEEN